MKKERKDSTRNHIKAMLALFCVMFIVLSVYLGYIVNVYGNRWFASPYNTRVANRKGTIAAGMLLSASLDGMNGLNAVSFTSPGKRLSEYDMCANGNSALNTVCSKCRPPASVPRFGP